MEKKRILVCGGRDFKNEEFLKRVLDGALMRFGVDGMLIIHGGARGADQMAGEWAKRIGVEVIVEKADWNKHGFAAGPIRNQKMLDEHKPDAVVAMPGGKGTKHMVKIAKEKLGEDKVLAC